MRSRCPQAPTLQSALFNACDVCCLLFEVKAQGVNTLHPSPLPLLSPLKPCLNTISQAMSFSERWPGQSRTKGSLSAGGLFPSLTNKTAKHPSLSAEEWRALSHWEKLCVVITSVTGLKATRQADYLYHPPIPVHFNLGFIVASLCNTQRAHCPHGNNILYLLKTKAEWWPCRGV